MQLSVYFSLENIDPCDKEELTSERILTLKHIAFYIQVYK